MPAFLDWGLLLAFRNDNQDRINLEVAGLVVSLLTDDPAMATRIRNRYREFLVADAVPLVLISLALSPGALFIHPEPGPLTIEASYENGYLNYRSYQVRGEIDLERGKGVAELAPRASVENLLRAVYAWLCIKNNAMLLHSAGMIRNGQGYCFFGPSGAGKTTISRLAANSVHVLSDDLVLIRLEETGWRLFGVPFRGALSDTPLSNRSAPLNGVFRLYQDTAHYVTVATVGQSVADLVVSSPFVSREPSLTDSLLRICDQLANAVPIRYLHFTLDGEFWSAIDESYEHVPIAAPTDRR